MDVSTQLTTLTFCLTMERSDGAGLAITSHDRCLNMSSVTFRPSPSFTPAAVKRSLELAVCETEIEGAIEADALTATDLSSGRWDGARTRLNAIDWDEQAREPIALVEGQLAEMNVASATYSAEIRGLGDALAKAPCPITSPECRADFGDKQCRVNLAGRQQRRVVRRNEGQVLWVEGELDEGLLFGEARWLSGANTGLAGLILQVGSDFIRLREQPRLPVLPGDKIRLTEGCDKRLSTCAVRFKNAANFRGEPHLPGNDVLTRYPGA